MITKYRLLQIARKMHLWIFLHSDNEDDVYKELGLTDKELVDKVKSIINEGNNDKNR